MHNHVSISECVCACMHTHVHEGNVQFHVPLEKLLIYFQVWHQNLLMSVENKSTGSSTAPPS